MKIAYSYLRFSTPEQAEGDSKRRQIERTEKWATANGYTLDATLSAGFSDEGRSGRKGKRPGLEKFLTLIEAGVIPKGSALVVENIDRLSRARLSVANELARTIIKSGVDLITLFPFHHFTAASLDDLRDTIILNLYFARAFEDSERKSDLTLQNWTIKRKEILKKQPVTALCPFWLDILQDGVAVPPGRGKIDWQRKPLALTYQLNDKAKFVKELFKLASEGYGCLRLSQVAAANDWRFRVKYPTIHEIWRTLKNRSVLGEYQSCYMRNELGVRVPSGEVVHGYYPAAVSADLFHKVQAAIANRVKKPGGRTGPKVTNLFSGLVFDAKMPTAPMYIITTRGVPAFVNFLALKKIPGASNWQFPYATFETAILKTCRELSPALLMPKTPAADLVAELEGSLVEHGLKVKRAKARADNAKTEAEEQVAYEQLVKLHEQQGALEKELESARERVSSQPADQLKTLHSLIDELAAAKDMVQSRTLVRGLLSSLIERIEIYIQRKGRYKKRAWIWVEFTSGIVRKIFTEVGGATITEVGDNRNVLAGGGWE